MPVYAVGEKVPVIHESAFIAPTATVVGDVRIEAGASIWYGAVVRGDTSYAVIGAGANIQDGAVVHGRATAPAIVGEEASVAHNAVIHGATIGARALIANGAQVLDGAVVGEGALVAAGSVVLPETEIPAGMLAAGTPAEVKRSIEGTPSQEWVENNPGRYAGLAAEHLAGLREITRDDARMSGP
ncbi:MAG: gamma carbonic anhydrase family protein [Chloroflexi bacterium]|nr:gamma carbonic anhydrase family protein [Chloroflexota bacterium]